MDEKRVESSERFCPRYQRAVEIVGRRWSGAVLRAMLAGASRFGEIQEAIPDLSNRMLSERLRELEGEGIVERVVVPERPVRIEYRLTEKGLALHDVVDPAAEITCAEIAFVVEGARLVLQAQIADEHLGAAGADLAVDQLDVGDARFAIGVGRMVGVFQRADCGHRHLGRPVDA